MNNEQNKEQKIKKAISLLDELIELLNERIVDLNQVKGWIRHAYFFYRKYVLDAKEILER